jgi:glycosyltransferase involved in cell wall biosynthesis
MDQQKNSAKISAVVPAYNEAARIGVVLEVLEECRVLSEIIVVDDGSSDNTEQVVKKYRVKYIRMSQNSGKGAAMERGVKEATSDIIFFCDADIRGLKASMIEEMAQPVIQGKVEMFIAMRNRKSYVLRFILAFIPLLGGERVLTKSLWESVPSYYKERFRIEAGLNFYAKYYGKGFRFKVFHGLTQTIKEKKYGLWKGFVARMLMMRDYLVAQIKLEWFHIPRNVLGRRLFLFQTASHVFFLGIALFLGLAVYFGPRQFLLRVFARELSTDPDAPFVHLLLKFVSQVSVEFLIALATLIATINIIFILISIPKMIRLIYTYSRKWKKSVLSSNNSTEEIIGEKKEIF